MSPLERWRSAAALAALCAAVPATAHHSAKIFDPDTVLALPGTVTRFSWTNPHTYIYVETACCLSPVLPSVSTAALEASVTMS